MMRNCTVVALAIALLSITASAQESSPDAKKAAVESAQAWLVLVDNGKYADSWETAAEFFKNAVGKEQWEKQLAAARKPFGKVLSRKIKSKAYTTTLPRAPEGEYVLILYETSFDNNKSATERVTPMLDKDGKWRVSGYYIK